MTNSTKIITIEFEVDNDLAITAEKLHEALCLSIYEGDMEAFDNVTGYVNDIRIVEKK